MIWTFEMKRLVIFDFAVIAVSKISFSGRARPGEASI
jgi:hypothetical protein